MTKNSNSRKITLSIVITTLTIFFALSASRYSSSEISAFDNIRNVDYETINGEYQELLQKSSTPPLTALDQAYLCEAELGPLPTFNCQNLTPIPILVNGVEVFVSQPWGACDNPDLKGSCDVGSRIGRFEGTHMDGTPRPEVVWVTFCRRDDNFAQMIGWNTTTGASCFFELNENYMPLTDGVPDGNVPVPADANYNAAWKAPVDVAVQQCVSCHSADPFIHTPFIAAAKIVGTNQTILPELAIFQYPYCHIGPDFAAWNPKYISIQGNACTSCHRISKFDEFNEITGSPMYDYDAIMPPGSPHSMTADYTAVVAIINNINSGQTSGTNWSYQNVPDCQVTAIEENSLNNENALFEVFPNPSTNQIQINTNLQGKITIQIFDMNGNLAYKVESYEENAFIDISTLSHGVYSVKANNFEESIIKRLIILK
jgi:hypothetical protein